MSKCPDTGAMTFPEQRALCQFCLAMKPWTTKFKLTHPCLYDLRDAIHNKDLPDCYTDHPMIWKHEGLVLPVALFVDGDPILAYGLGHRILVGEYVERFPTLDGGHPQEDLLQVRLSRMVHPRCRIPVSALGLSRLGCKGVSILST
jgi:hypothetical protein